LAPVKSEESGTELIRWAVTMKSVMLGEQAAERLDGEEERLVRGCISGDRRGFKGERQRDTVEWERLCVAVE
jgi:hypothetical protein